MVVKVAGDGREDLTQGIVCTKQLPQMRAEFLPLHRAMGRDLLIGSVDNLCYLLRENPFWYETVFELVYTFSLTRLSL